MAKKKPQKTNSKKRPKSKAGPKTAKTKSKPKAEKKARAESETREEIFGNLKHLNAVALELGVGCEIYHDDELGGYVVNLSETSEDRSFETTAEAEEYLHEQE